MAYQIIDLLKEENNLELLKFFEENAQIEKGAKHKVFEDRYDSKLIQDEKLFLEKLNYIHNNPCVEKWGLAEAPEDYQHSSANNYFNGKGVYEVDIMEL